MLQFVSNFFFKLVSRFEMLQEGLTDICIATIIYKILLFQNKAKKGKLLTLFFGDYRCPK